MAPTGKEDAVTALDEEQLGGLIERAQRLDPDAYDALVEAFGPRLFGFLYRLTGSRDEADDLLQDVFLRVVRMLPSYTHSGRFEAWIFRIAANLGRDRIRRVRRTPTIVSLTQATDDGEDAERAGGDTDGAGGAPDAPLIRREQLDRMQIALGQLPAPEREVIMLRHYSELGFAEIADLMGTPLGTALARAHRGLARLRQLMEADQ